MIKNNIIIASYNWSFRFKRKRRKFIQLPVASGLGTAIYSIVKNYSQLYSPDVHKKQFRPKITWVAWHGYKRKVKKLDEAIKNFFTGKTTELCGISFSRSEYEGFFRFSNEILWPIFHGFIEKCNLDNDLLYKNYIKSNQKYASAISLRSDRSTLIWVHDYELIFLAKELHKLGIKQKIGYFLHIPFPPLNNFDKLRQAKEIILALLEYDFIGFQTQNDKNNFLDCLSEYFPRTKIETERLFDVVLYGGKRIILYVSPISIDVQEFSQKASEFKTIQKADKIRDRYTNNKILLSVGRSDYTKGYLEELAVVELLSNRNPNLINHLSLILIVPTTRQELPVYKDLVRDIGNKVRSINGRYSASLKRNLVYYYPYVFGHDKLIPYYRAAHVMLVLSLADGMNLVAKEYVACGPEDGVLILSRFAGAVNELHGALIVNPYNKEEVADTIKKAITMGGKERRHRMGSLRKMIIKNDIGKWIKQNFKILQK